MKRSDAVASSVEGMRMDNISVRTCRDGRERVTALHFNQQLFDFT